MTKKIKIVLIASCLILGGIALAAPVLPEPIPTNLQLQTDKTNVIGNLSRNGVVKYAYRSDVRINSKPFEVIGKRTKHSRTFTTENENQYITEIISGVPQYYKDSSGEWWQADYATTTQEAFDEQMKVSFLGKLIPSALATESTFYPAAGQNSPVDGYVRTQNGTSYNHSWAELIVDPGNSSGDTQTVDDYINIESDTTSAKWRRLDRVIFLFDTSTIPDTDNIDSAILSLFGSTKADNLSITPNINIYESAPASNSALANGDFDSLDNVAFSTAISYAGWNTSGYNNFTLNAFGLVNITKTGISKFGARNQEYDADEAVPSWSNNALSQVKGYFADEAGTGKDPKLVVTHSAGAVAGFNSVTIISEE